MIDPLEQLWMPIVPVVPRPEFAAALLRRIEGIAAPVARETASVRYFVKDLDAAVASQTKTARSASTSTRSASSWAPTSPARAASANQSARLARSHARHGSRCSVLVHLGE